MKNKAKKSERVIFRLTPNERIKLKETATKQGLTMSEYLRQSFNL